MTRHLTNDELVDLADGIRAEDSVPHLLGCETCQRQLADLRSALAAAADVEVPEPSPLFWDHFSARVRQAVAAEPAPSVAWVPGGWPLRVAIPVSMLAGAALALAVVMSGQLGVGRDEPATPAAPEATAVTPSGEASATVDTGDDLLLSLVADLADDVEMDADAVTEAGLSVRTGTADRVIADLGDEERSALEQLLKKELARPGA